MDGAPEPDVGRTYREAIDRQIRSWLTGAPTQLADDAARPFDADSDRFRGRFLLLGMATTGERRPDDRAVQAAATVELLYGQALLNARASGLLDTGFQSIDRSHALLASDYLHSLAYAGLRDLEVEPSIGAACFRSVSAASSRLASAWARVEEGGSASIDCVPIEPIVTATAGDLAGILGRADEDCRRALRTTGTALGVARWHSDRDGFETDRLKSVDELLPEEWPGSVVGDGIGTDSIDELLKPLPDSQPLSRLRELADSVLAGSMDRITYE
ncbi:polyprenyl synthetase family protein [Halorhabdus amylolytica]|uniref:hypothetical protein n=1 Tax=Halorhabdus amylolytica TaxID=2559573 RepID=UPI0010AA349E|nr:hypothetical protein [Halorhabdus amylolytica]